MEKQDRVRAWTDAWPDEVDRNAWKVSASQIKTWQACPRKWGFKYLDGIPDPPGKAAQFGSAVHAVLEDYFKTGELPDTTIREGKVAAAGLAHYPRPQDEAPEVEREIHFEADGVVYRGFADLIYPREKPAIFDHKTSSDPDKWGLKAQDLPKDPQALVYSLFGVDYYKSDGVSLSWVYYKTRGRPIASRVTADLTRDEVAQAFEEIVAPTGRAITQARADFVAGKIEGGNDLAASPSACGDFGGCPYAEFCHRTQDEALTAAFGPKTTKEDQIVSLKELLAKKKKLAPPRPAEIVPINSPEAPKPVAAVEISKAVGQVTGNAATKKEKAREITAAAHEADTADEARALALEALRRVEPEAEPEAEAEAEPAPASAAREPTDPATVPTPSQEEIIAYLQAGVTHFARSRTGHREDTPFAHGRTLNSMRKAGLISYKAEGDFRAVTLLDEVKREPVKKAPKPVAAPKPVEEDKTPTAPARIKKSNDLPPISGEIELRPAPSHREVLVTFLVGSGGDVDKARALFAAYCDVFPL